MTYEEKMCIMQRVDHTLLAPDATWENIKKLCDEGIRYGTATVCIPPLFVRRAKEYVGDRLAICTVIGFPCGYATTAAKVAETADAVAGGADEIDMVIAIGDLKDGRCDQVEADIRAVKAACGKTILKVIIETCLLTEEEKIRMCEIVAAAGADFIKTSTGFSRGGATPEDITLFAAHRAPGLRIKAAGGISTFEDAQKFIDLGADRLGTSRLVRLLEAEK